MWARRTWSPVEPRSVAEIAETIGQLVGKSVEYVDVPTEMWLERLTTLPFMNPHFLKHLERVAEDTRNGWCAGVTEVVETIGGRKPKSRRPSFGRTYRHFGAKRFRLALRATRIKPGRS